ncbi:hypothetical protein GBA52_004148 [Prunus armeniaca]|nr:hypothetical protein GBA52_004148 [Prunus armeniaca]
MGKIRKEAAASGFVTIILWQTRTLRMLERQTLVMHKLKGKSKMVVSTFVAIQLLHVDEPVMLGFTTLAIPHLAGSVGSCSLGEKEAESKLA